MIINTICPNKLTIYNLYTSQPLQRRDKSAYPILQSDIFVRNSIPSFGTKSNPQASLKDFDSKYDKIGARGRYFFLCECTNPIPQN